MAHKKRFVARCTPTLGAVSIWWAQAVENVMWPMNVGKAVFNLLDVKGGEIAEVRNQLVVKALAFEGEAREVSHILWIDDDVIPPPGVLLQLLHRDRDIASGVYFTKVPGLMSEPLIFPGEGQGTCKFVPDRLMEVWGCGMGLALVRTDVYRKMREAGIGRDKYGNPEWYRTTGRPEELRVEDQVTICGGTEDLFFCDRAVKLGYKPLVDTGKHCFAFHFCMRRQTAYPEAQWAQAQKHQRVTWDTPEGVVSWE